MAPKGPALFAKPFLYQYSIELVIKPEKEDLGRDGWTNAWRIGSVLGADRLIST
jgi:hypothetical protein